MAAPVLHRYVPRKYFIPFHARNQRYAVVIVHRRGGKSVMAVNDMVGKALRTRKKNWFGAYIAPFFGQAKQIAWTYLKQAVVNIPGAKVHESETKVTLPNGAIIKIFGADNPDALRGLYFDYVLLDETAQIPRRVWTEIIRPALADRQGVVVFLGTPKGKNFFWEVAEKARRSNGKWFYLNLDVTKTKILPPKELEEIKEDLDEAEWNQEFMCSFESALRGSYYEKQLKELIGRGGITNVPFDATEKVHVAMDVGRADATAIWFWQVIDGKFRIIDYFESTGLDADETCDVLDMRPYSYETVWLPHDAFHHTWSSRKSGFDTLIERGLPARKVPKPDNGNRVYHGVDAVRKVLRTYPLEIDAEKCAQGIECLRNYSRKYDVDRQVFSDAPNHDKWSHGADGFRYLALSLNPADVGRSKERAQQKAARALQLNNAPAGPFNRPTFGEQLTAHDQRQRELAQYRNKARY